ncbi:hypothetical protein AF335_02780 [Streptomyces eurocidicus]|uniref:Putative membrane protein YccC n=1 Tax=Streptomyces eurocidicus TaxID=66423 RepID=A0A2N8P2S7_STREU|nr:hypothetical protein [Streptomyces eurocidicus]MBB5117453.1 putative membrane protein YccC [Streptomyces eurocidicus]MBF6053296.1 hypothetical protein [Streptomyces eurocidicus]PNE35301.1 hypothetical protein AF335_02780 [Streptomyces eurocidicus]
MEAVAVIVALIFAVLVALGVIATVKTVRAVKRGVDRTVTQARRTVEDTRLKARQYVQPGPAGEVAELRISLRTSMRATQEALRQAAPEDASLSEALQLFERLSAHGHELDEELKRLEAEPDRARVAACLPGLRERTERVRGSADSLRWAAQDRARRFAEDDLEALSGQIRIETGALRHWTVEEPEETAAGAAGSGAGAGRGAGAGPASGPAGRPETAPAAGERPAITGGAESWQPGYSWQKTRRPESTT